MKEAKGVGGCIGRDFESRRVVESFERVFLGGVDGDTADLDSWVVFEEAAALESFLYCLYWWAKWFIMSGSPETMHCHERTNVRVLLDIVYGWRATIDIFKRPFPSFDLSADGGYLSHRKWVET